MNKIKDLAAKVLDAIISLRALRFVCFGMILLFVIVGIDHGIKGEYKAVHNDINWIIWMFVVIMLTLGIEFQEVKTKAYQEYSGHLEDYKESAEKYIETLRDKSELQSQLIKRYESQIESLKSVIEKSDQIIDEYKSSKKSRF